MASGEAEIVPRVRGDLGWAVPWSRAVSQACIGPLWESGEDPGAVGDLQMPHGIRVQSDDGVVIICGFFLSRIVVE